jgi:hypothetical protein
MAKPINLANMARRMPTAGTVSGTGHPFLSPFGERSVSLFEGFSCSSLSLYSRFFLLRLVFTR